MNEKIKLYIPDYYKDFKCKAGACTDTCCTAWEIDIDEASYQRYLAEAERLEKSGEDPEFAAKLRNAVVKDDCYHFDLEGRTYCPFFTESGLCEIQMKLGEEALCQICDDHPRYYEYFPDRKEAGVGICCEAACELIMFKQEPVKFVEELHDAAELLTADMLAVEEDASEELEDLDELAVTGVVYDSEELEATGELEASEGISGDEQWGEVPASEEESLDAMNSFMFDARSALIGIAQNRSFPISERISLCEKAGGYIQDMIEDALLFGDELSDPYEICDAICGDESEEGHAEVSSNANAGANEDAITEANADANAEADVNAGSGYILSPLYDSAELAKVLKEHMGAIPLKEEWSKLISALNDNCEQLMSLEQAFLNAGTEHELRYEQLLVYFMFRYVGKATYDGDLYSKLKFGMDSLCIIHLAELYAMQQGVELTREVLIRIASGYSKEIEYSEENIDMLMY